uniref:Uncharacterized protein n=1 Tax=Anguilla anguilla TaxID=7936 RepID=A0A0E9SQV4_ANGAN
MALAGLGRGILQWLPPLTVHRLRGWSGETKGMHGPTPVEHNSQSWL